MVEEKRCNPPKKNSKLLQKFKEQNENEFLEPLPLKRLKLDEEGSDRLILGEIHNQINLVPMEREFSFGLHESKAKQKQRDKENQEVFKTPSQPQQ